MAVIERTGHAVASQAAISLFGLSVTPLEPRAGVGICQTTNKGPCAGGAHMRDPFETEADHAELGEGGPGVIPLARRHAGISGTATPWEAEP